MSTKVYLVTEGEYSDYHICGAFSSEALAQEFMDDMKKDEKWSEYQIEPYELDIPANVAFPYYVWMNRNGEVFHDARRADDGPGVYENSTDTAIVGKGKTLEHARRNAEEIRRALKALNDDHRTWPELFEQLKGEIPCAHD